MKITFLGATKTVTGSNFLIEAANKKFLVDCGLYQGAAKEIFLNTDDFIFEATDIDFVLLTHAHIDHSGRIPKLYKEGFRGDVIATKPTVDLCSIMLPDSGHIQVAEVEWLNRKRERQGKHPVEPLYTQQDAEQCLDIFKMVEYDQIIQIDENIKVRFKDAGHMLGSSIIEVWIQEDGKETKVVFSGDLGNTEIPLLKEPSIIEEADYLVLESTYGNRFHEENYSKADEFLDIVSKTLDRGGNVIIPSFAVGRTQEMLYELNKTKEKRNDKDFYEKYQKLMEIPVYVDSPLAISATEIFMDNLRYFDNDVQEDLKRGDNPLEFPGLQFTRTAEESKALNESVSQSIIISASGMCEVGRIKHHLKHNLWDPNNTILFVGFQAQGTLGRRILDGEKKIKIFGEEISVNAEIKYIEGFSGHADQNGLLKFISSFSKKPSKIFLVHGEPEGQIVLSEKIKEQFGIDTEIPGFGDVFKLENIAQKVGEVTSKNINKYLRLEILERIELIKEQLQDTEGTIKKDLSTNYEDEKAEALKLKLQQLYDDIMKLNS